MDLDSALVVRAAAIRLEPAQAATRPQAAGAAAAAVPVDRVAAAAAVAALPDLPVAGEVLAAVVVAAVGPAAVAVRADVAVAADPTAPRRSVTAPAVDVVPSGRPA